MVELGAVIEVDKKQYRKKKLTFINSALLNTILNVFEYQSFKLKRMIHNNEIANFGVETLLILESCCEFIGQVCCTCGEDDMKEMVLRKLTNIGNVHNLFLFSLSCICSGESYGVFQKVFLSKTYHY